MHQTAWRVLCHSAALSITSVCTFHGIIGVENATAYAAGSENNGRLRLDTGRHMDMTGIIRHGTKTSIP